MWRFAVLALGAMARASAIRAVLPTGPPVMFFAVLQVGPLASEPGMTVSPSLRLVAPAAGTARSKGPVPAA